MQVQTLTGGITPLAPPRRAYAHGDLHVAFPCHGLLQPRNFLREAYFRYSVVPFKPTCR